MLWKNFRKKNRKNYIEKQDLLTDLIGNDHSDKLLPVITIHITSIKTSNRVHDCLINIWRIESQSDQEKDKESRRHREQERQIVRILIQVEETYGMNNTLLFIDLQHCE